MINPHIHQVKIVWTLIQMKDMLMVIQFLNHQLYESDPMISLGDKCIIVEFTKAAEWNENLTAIFDALKTLEWSLKWRLL